LYKDESQCTFDAVSTGNNAEIYTFTTVNWRLIEIGRKTW